jgi:uncharacterized protein
MLKKIARLLILLLVIIISTILVLYYTSKPDNSLNIKDSFFGNAAAEPIYKSYSKSSTYIGLPDGTQIAIDYFIPTEGPRTDKFPVIFEYTPYGRSFVITEMPLWQRVYAKIKTGFCGPVFDRAYVKSTRIFLSQGYAYVVADMRGSGASSGSQMPLWPRLGEDGKEIIDWITSQPWSDGKVGMTGQSFVGWSQFITAKYQPQGLKCLAPSCIMFETYSEGTRPGGITSYRWLSGYSDILKGVNRNKFDPANKLWSFLPTTPVIDEDGDGHLDDEIPISTNGDPTVFYDDLPFSYADGVDRENIYANNTLQHLDNFLAEELIVGKARYIDSSLPFADDSIMFYDTSPGSFINEMADAGIAVYNLGGWFDGFTKGTTKLFANLEGKIATYMMIAPRYHRPINITNAYHEYLGYQGKFGDQMILEQLKFYNRYLKNQEVDNFDKPVKIYTFNKGWEKFASWPPDSKSSVWFFNQDHQLTSRQQATGTNNYPIDYTLSSNYGAKHLNRWLLWTSPEVVMDRSRVDSASLVFETAVLSESIQVTGHPVVSVFLSSTQADADVFVYLSDVDANGKVLYVTEGQLRSDWHNLAPAKEQVRNREEIKPELPWHGYKESQKDLEALDSGKVVEMRLDLMPTSWLFKKGHKLRVSITGADFGNFIIHPALSTNNKPEECPETTWTVYSTKEFPSRIELPVVGGK